MKKAVMGMAVAALALFVMVNYGYAGAAKKGEKGMIIGEVIEIVSYVMKGDHGPDHVNVGQSRSSQGWSTEFVLVQ